MSDDAQPYTGEELDRARSDLIACFNRAECLHKTRNESNARQFDDLLDRLLATAKQGVEAQERLTRAHQSNENRYRRMVEALGNDAYSFDSALEKLIAAAVERGVRETPDTERLDWSEAHPEKTHSLYRGWVQGGTIRSTIDAARGSDMTRSGRDSKGGGEK